MINSAPKKWLQWILGLMLCQYIACDCLLPDLETEFPDGKVAKWDVPDAPVPVAPTDAGNQTIVNEFFVLQFACFEGYTLFGSELLQCVDGKWSSDLPFCTGNKCSNPPQVINATYVIHGAVNGEPVIGSSANYSCEDRFHLANDNASTLRCTINEESRESSWVGEIPACQGKTTCSDPGVSYHGERYGDCCLSGDELSYSCLDGYELVGDEEISCLKNGQWSSKRPGCRPLSGYCNITHPIPHGVVTGKKKGDYFVEDEEAQLMCEPGYKVTGNDFVYCGVGNKWEEDFGTCEVIRCGHPGDVPNGRIPELKNSNLTEFQYGFEITYVCDERYRVYSGDSWRTCDKNGWSGYTPRCQVIRCPDPGNPPSGLKEGTNYSVGSRVRFSCFSGYELLGSEEIVCKPNGRWDGEVARCNEPSNYCPDPGTPINGFKNMTEYKLGDRVRFRCREKHFLLGSEVRKCLPNKTWSGTNTTCVGQYDFDDPVQVRDMLNDRVAEKREQQRKEVQKYNELLAAVANGNFRSLDIFFQGRIILYFAFDVSGSITLSNFKKGIEFAKAIVRKVGITEDGARAGAVAFGSKAEGLFLPLIYNNTVDVLNALDRVNYTGGGTAASSALNWIREDSMPLVRNWLGDAEIKSVIFILTDGKANMGGDPTKEANILKSEGAEIYCVGITGDVKMQALYDIASISEYGGEMKPNAFILQDYKTLAWLVQNITSGTANYFQCGLGMEHIGITHGRIVGGNKSAEAWPWMAALYMGEKAGKQKFGCGGSIIHQNFILTAAHCFYDKNGRLRESKEITVKLGVIALSNKTDVKVFEVRKIHMHKHYGGHDYDIALLELEKPIEYNPFIRPVCLPKGIPAENEFYRPGSNVWIIGWGHPKVMRKSGIRNPMPSDSLREISLPIQSRQTCLDSLKDDAKEGSFSERMFCAGTGEGKNDSCRGDSGGPAMISRKNEEGYTEWTQVGIVGWGLGCGLVDEYGFYTNVNGMLSWVHSTIEDALNWVKK